MFGRARDRILVLVALLPALTPLPLYAVPGEPDMVTAGAPLQPLIEAKLQFYNQAFPEIEFLSLRGGRYSTQELPRLGPLLGAGARTLDYEHPPELGAELLTLAVQRVALMLQQGGASASLFRVGRGSTAARANVCVLTLDDESIATDDAQATRHLLDVSDQRFARIPPSRYLKYSDHLAFVIDHEIFHCLDAFYNGPIPVSHRPHAAEYASYRNENGADAFGIAMRLLERGNRDYVDNLIRIRALTLLQEDPDHYTDRSMQGVIAVYPAAIRGRSARELFELATRIRDREVADYDAYIVFRAAALRASERLGAPVSDQSRAQFAGIEPDATVTESLIYRVLTSYRQLFARSD